MPQGFFAESNVGYRIANLETRVGRENERHRDYVAHIRVSLDC